MPLLLEERADLRAAFDLKTFHGMLNFITWWEANGSKEYPKISQYLNSVNFNLSQTFTSSHQITIADGPSIPNNPAVNKVIDNLEKKINSVKAVEEIYLGVNVIGLSEYSLGIGEDARMAKNTLDYLNIPSQSIRAPIKCNSNKSTSTSIVPINTKKYPIDLFCLPPVDMIRLNFEGGEDLLNRKSYKIGAWPWELPYWPVQFEKITNFANEIWAQSEYVFNCFSKLRDIPVYRMPMVVDIGIPKKINRSYLKIKEDAFIFYTMFDGNSILSRKNPIATVLAFEAAFKNKRNANVSLVIKAMNINADNIEWRKIREIANSDSRIIIIDQHLEKSYLINLMSTFDAFISLHRSEGFGRVIAEAMLLGQPVITSNFSGNIDFCNHDTSYLVDGHLVGVGKNEYHFSEGQYWFEPDINIAAHQMIKVYENPSETLRISQNAKKYIQENYSIQSAGNFYKNRLSLIAKIIQ